MTNDLSTLSGALLEMKDELIYQLGQKGVTATYSSTDGLLGLIGRISDIQTGGGSCYNVVFDKASYITTGTATISVTVLKNYAPCTNESVTFTSSTSTTTTATTNSSGVATATITFSGSTTLTASIGGVSDTASITVSSAIDLSTYLLDLQSYEFFSGNSSKLTIENTNELKGSSTIICTNSNTFTNSNNYTLTFDWKLSSGYDGGLVIGDRDDWISITQQYNLFNIQHGTGTNDNANPLYDSISSSHRYSSYVPVVITRDGYDWTLDVNDGEITSSWTATVDHPNRFGIRTWSPNCYVKNLELK